MEGHAPLAGYAYYYHNQPDFLRTNLTLRLAVAPMYLDSELGFVDGLGPQTDFAIGLAGGGFADSYNEIRGGKCIQGESFDGNGGEISASVYHLFNPGDEIPLNFVVRGTAHYSILRAQRRHGVQFCNCPPTTAISACAPACAGAASSRRCFRRWRWNCPSWYEGHLRTDSGAYGFGGDRRIANSELAFVLGRSRAGLHAARRASRIFTSA